MPKGKTYVVRKRLGTLVIDNGNVKTVQVWNNMKIQNIGMHATAYYNVYSHTYAKYDSQSLAAEI